METLDIDRDTLGCQEGCEFFLRRVRVKLERVTKIQPDCMQCSFSRLYGGLEYPASRGLFTRKKPLLAG